MRPKVVIYPDDSYLGTHGMLLITGPAALMAAGPFCI